MVYMQINLLVLIQYDTEIAIIALSTAFSWMWALQLSSHGSTDHGSLERLTANIVTSQLLKYNLSLHEKFEIHFQSWSYFTLQFICRGVCLEHRRFDIGVSGFYY